MAPGGTGQPVRGSGVLLPSPLLLGREQER